jgi:spermidine synthase
MVRKGQSDRLATAYLLMPAISAIALVAVCLTYPHVFPALAEYDLVAGAFAACMLLLGIPLVTTSAMNPLLIAILVQTRTATANAADAGAGRVFFTSTVGSVAGVIVTAFWLIPIFSNFVVLVLIAVVLAVLPIAGLVRMRPLAAGRKLLIVTSLIALVASAGLLWQADAYLGRLWPVKFAGSDWTLEARVSSMFGTVKVLKSAPIDDRGRFIRVYFQDGLIQNRSRSDGMPLTFYTFALEALAWSYQPRMDSTLVLGLGAGVVPARLAERGIKVTGVDIDPASFVVARQYFGLDTSRINAVQADARTYLRGCRERYDVIVVDLFHGDGTPDYLITRDFFADLRRCIRATGVAVFNTFADLEFPAGYAHLLATLRAEFPFVTIYRPNEQGARHTNSFVVASTREITPVPSSIRDVPPLYARELDEMLAHPRGLDPSLLRGGQIITDARSNAAADIAKTQMYYRQQVSRSIPAAFLIN